MSSIRSTRVLLLLFFQLLLFVPAVVAVPFSVLYDFALLFLSLQAIKLVWWGNIVGRTKLVIDKCLISVVKAQATKKDAKSI